MAAQRNGLDDSGTTDGVFVSAADLFSLLSIVLLSLVVLSQRTSLRSIDFSEVALNSKGGKPIDPAKKPQARWEGANSSSSECVIRLEQFPPEQNRGYGVGCIPKAFSTSATQVDDGLKRIADDYEMRSGARMDVLAICQKHEGEQIETTIANCAKLQWTLFEAGFNPLISTKDL